MKEQTLQENSSMQADSTKTKELVELAMRSQSYWDMATYAGCLKHNELQEEVKIRLKELTGEELADFMILWAEARIASKEFQSQMAKDGVHKKIARSK